MAPKRWLQGLAPAMAISLVACAEGASGDDVGYSSGTGIFTTGGSDTGDVTGGSDVSTDSGASTAGEDTATGDTSGAGTSGDSDTTGATTDDGGTTDPTTGTTGDSGTTDPSTGTTGDSGTTDPTTGGTTDPTTGGTTDPTTGGSTGGTTDPTTGGSTGGTTDPTTGGSTSGTTGGSTGGEPDYGNCGWLASSDWYACGGDGEDPGGNPIACPPGLSDGQACGSVTGVGCCDTDGTNYYCNQGGTIASEACGGTDPGTTGTTGGTTDPTTGGTTDPSTSGTTGGSTDGGSTGTGGTVTPEDGVLADDITVGQVQITQGVAIGLGSGTSPTSPNGRNARVVKEREALFRAGWSTLSGFSPRQIEGQLILERNGVTTVYKDTRTVSGSPNFSSYDGTFRWAVPASAMQPGTSYAIGFFEPGATSGPAPSGNPRHPASGYADLGVPSTPMELEVVLVPVRWQYGSNDRTPNLNASNVEVIRKDIYEHNPVSSVNISVRSQPAVYNGAINLNSVLNLISSTRSNDNPPSNVYYEGLVDFGCAYVSGSSCSQWGGTTGVGYVPGTSSWSDNQRASISVFYNVAQTAGTLTHELGHNQGLNHAPCGGASGADSSYPYSGGVIGSQGWRVNSTEFFAGSNAKDYMGYCSPSWVADWTWERAANRIATMTAAAFVQPEPEGWMLQGLIDHEGNESWVLVRGTVPEDELDPEIRVRFRSAGDVVSERPAYEGWLSDADTRVLVVPLPDAGNGVFPLAGIDALERVEPNGELYEVDMLSIAQ